MQPPAKGCEVSFALRCLFFVLLLLLVVSSQWPTRIPGLGLLGSRTTKSPDFTERTEQSGVFGVHISPNVFEVVALRHIVEK